MHTVEHLCHLIHYQSHGQQTEIGTVEMEEVYKLNQSLNETLEDKDGCLQRKLFMKQVFRSDANVRRYTGVPGKDVFEGLFKLLESHTENIYNNSDSNKQKPGPTRKLTPFEEFTLTMIRLRTGMLASVLADIYGVSESRVSQIFNTWINLLHFIFKPLIKWPSKKKVQKHMPESFKKKYPETRAVIDCTEFFIQKPSNTKAQSLTYSSYKSHNTAKCLVAIDPTGAFTFISETWGGNASDRFITQQSGFIELVEEGDDIMADRGFTIRDLLLHKKATLNMPPFTRKCTFGNKKKLNVKEIYQTRQIAMLRIHVERAIGRLKTFTLLNQTIPLSCQSILDQMIVVAAFIKFTTPTC